MKSFYETTIPTTQDEVLFFFQEAIRYRESHKDESEKIALFVFDTTHQSRLGVYLSSDLEQIRYEFGALEAPGQPEGDDDLDQFEDRLWKRLGLMIEKVQNEKRTV
jgi:hypothetical protein